MLELKNVTKCFGNFKALDDLTMTVPQGAVYGLVGPTVREKVPPSGVCWASTGPKGARSP